MRLLGAVDVVPLQGAILGAKGRVTANFGGAIAGCHCSVLWWGEGRRPTLGEWTWCHCWVGANFCFISSSYIQGHQFHPDIRENNNEFCLELLADVTLFSTLITQKLVLAIWGLCWYIFFETRMIFALKRSTFCVFLFEVAVLRCRTSCSLGKHPNTREVTRESRENIRNDTPKHRNHGVTGPAWLFDQIRASRANRYAGISVHGTWFSIRVWAFCVLQQSKTAVLRCVCSTDVLRRGAG